MKADSFFKTLANMPPSLKVLGTSNQEGPTGRGYAEETRNAKVFFTQSNIKPSISLFIPLLRVLDCTTHTHTHTRVLCSVQNPWWACQTFRWRYLIGALPDCVDELLDDQVDAFQTRLFQLNDLLFHYGFERQVGGEQACPEGHTDKTDTHT